MKANTHNRNLIATAIALGLGLAGSNALAMTSDHDTVPAGTDGKGTVVKDSDSGKHTVADNVIGGKVGNFTLEDVSQ